MLLGAPFLLADTASGELTEIASAPALKFAFDTRGRAQPIFPMIAGQPVAGSRGIWSGVPSRAELLHFGWDGTLDRVVRFPDDDAAFEEAERERILEWHRSRTAGIPAEAAADLADPVVLDQMPVMGDVLIDSSGHVWVQEVRDDRDPEDWEFATPRGSSRWKVFDPTGRWLGSVDVPDAFQPFAIGPDSLVGVQRDEEGVEFIHEYPLDRT